MNPVVATTLFIFGTGFLLIVSRRSVFRPQSHGFYRFFAWELILVLALLNIPTWFKDPFSWHQVISWVLLCISLFLVIHGLQLLRQIGKPDQKREGEPLLALEKTSRLVTTGAYRYIRHPLYSSLLFLGWGIFFKSPSWLDGGLVLLVTFFLVMTARKEEQENIAFFGDEYREYMKHSKMFIPFIF